jgi:membrane protease YdiL (CAAX protease family)
VIAPVEEVIWGGLVQPAVGALPTTALFAVKHGLVDGRWRRTLGLGLFGLGLGWLRRRSRALALGIHVACNAGGVALGHVTGRDQL